MLHCPPCLAQGLELTMMFTFQCLVYPPLQGKLPLREVRKEVTNGISSVHCVSNLSHRATLHNTDLGHVQHSVCIWLLGRLLGCMMLLPYSFLPLHLPYHKSAHEDEWLRAASLQEAEGYDPQ